MGDLHSSAEYEIQKRQEMRQKLFTMELEPLDQPLSYPSLEHYLFDRNFLIDLNPVEVVNLAFRCERLFTEQPLGETRKALEAIIKYNPYLTAGVLPDFQKTINYNQENKLDILATYKNLKSSTHTAPQAPIIKEQVLYLMDHCKLFLEPTLIEQLCTRFPEINEALRARQKVLALSNPLIQQENANQQAKLSHCIIDNKLCTKDNTDDLQQI